MERTINIDGTEYAVNNEVGPDGDTITLPDLAEDECWREHADELADDDIDSCYRYDLGNGNSLYINCEQGGIEWVSIEAVDMIDHLHRWWCNTNDGTIEFSEWLSSWGLEGLSVLTKANEGDEGPFRVWHEPQYYPGTCNAPQAGFAHVWEDAGTGYEQPTDEICEFATYEEAAAYVTNYYNEPSGYDGIPACNVMSHGQAGPDRLTIVRVDD